MADRLNRVKMVLSSNTEEAFDKKRAVLKGETTNENLQKADEPVSTEKEKLEIVEEKVLNAPVSPKNKVEQRIDPNSGKQKKVKNCNIVKKEPEGKYTEFINKYLTNKSEEPYTQNNKVRISSTSKKMLLSMKLYSPTNISMENFIDNIIRDVYSSFVKI